MLRLKPIFVFSLSLLIFGITTSCSTKKKNIESEIYEELNQAPSQKAWKRILGFSLTKHDNIKLYREANKWINTPYAYGGTTQRGVDCSGLVMIIYLEVYDKKIQRNSAAIMEKNCKEISKRKLKEGDLVFFSSRKNSDKISHVGIYLKDDKFLHASTSKGVVINSLNDKYYIDHFVCAGRVE